MKKLVFGALLLAAACTASDPAATSDADVVDVQVGGSAGDAFAPKAVTIKVGQTVRWTWAGGSHNVVSGTTCATSDGNFRSGSPQEGGTFDHVFEVAGTFPYYCEVHCDMGMTGTVVVQ